MNLKDAVMSYVATDRFDFINDTFATRGIGFKASGENFSVLASIGLSGAEIGWTGGFDGVRSAIQSIQPMDSFPRYGLDMTVEYGSRYACTPDYTIIKPNRAVLGERFADWTEDWWTWGLQAPENENPLTDETGQFAGVNNDGPVYFIAGNFGGETTRTIEVPSDRPLLVPMLTNAYITFDTDEKPRKLANEVLRDWKKSVTDVFAEIDGVEISRPKSYFLKSDYFSPGTPEPDSLLEGLLAGLVAPDDDLFPTRAAGYWLMIKGLDPGEHEIHVGGTLSDGFFVDLTIDVLVV
jgi:hypothetical protein